MTQIITPFQRKAIQVAAIDFNRSTAAEAWKGTRRMLSHFGYLGHLSSAELRRLSPTDNDAKIALMEYQSAYNSVLDLAAASVYGEPGIVNGTFGPATARLMAMPRCGEPDHAMRAGSGSWPAGCKNGQAGVPKDVHAISVSVDKTRMPSFLGRKDDPDSPFEQAWSLVASAYADIGMLLVREDGNASANTVITWQKGQGWIGLAVVPQSPSCGTRIWAKFDTVYSPADLINQWARLIAHELGHNMGLSHFSGGIMNAYIVTGVFTPTAWRNDTAGPVMIRFFGGVPIPIGDDNDNNPDPPDGSAETKTFTWARDNGQIIQVNLRAT